MTFEELQIEQPDATIEKWHQHPNGGGWIENTAIVDDSVFVDPTSIVFSRAEIHGIVSLKDYCWVFGDAKLNGKGIYLEHNVDVCELVTINGYLSLTGKIRLNGVMTIENNDKRHSSIHTW